MVCYARSAPQQRTRLARCEIMADVSSHLTHLPGEKCADVAQVITEYPMLFNDLPFSQCSRSRAWLGLWVTVKPFGSIPLASLRPCGQQRENVVGSRSWFVVISPQPQHDWGRFAQWRDIFVHFARISPPQWPLPLIFLVLFEEAELATKLTVYYDYTGLHSSYNHWNVCPQFCVTMLDGCCVITSFG